MLHTSQQYLAIEKIRICLLQIWKIMQIIKAGQKEGGTVLFSSKSNGNSIIIITIWNKVEHVAQSLPFADYDKQQHPRA
jgi:hypothetical protein